MSTVSPAALPSERPLFIRLSLPPGLEESLEGLAKEVLREQPKNIYAFAAKYFEQKLRQRNKGTEIRKKGVGLGRGLGKLKDLSMVKISSI